jgi:murein DD-endopeptidase MepM/ murein hydrolase activator NlpD
LVPPIRGEIVSSFGWKTDKLTNLKSFSPGIDIKPSPKAQQVVACAPGRVAYVGSLRGYDNFVILEHDDGYYSTYANLSSTLVELDDRVATGQKLGLKGSGPVHFELRQAREHLDPVIWLDIDAF